MGSRLIFLRQLCGGRGVTQKDSSREEMECLLQAFRVRDRQIRPSISLRREGEGRLNLPNGGDSRLPRNNVAVDEAQLTVPQIDTDGLG